MQSTFEQKKLIFFSFSIPDDSSYKFSYYFSILKIEVVWQRKIRLVWAKSIIRENYISCLYRDCRRSKRFGSNFKEAERVGHAETSVRHAQNWWVIVDNSCVAINLDDIIWCSNRNNKNSYRSDFWSLRSLSLCVLNDVATQQQRKFKSIRKWSKQSGFTLPGYPSNAACTNSKMF